MSIIQAIILGIVQGIAEFLPVSSSGHLQIFKEIMGVEITNNLAFDVALHAGTVCSTVVVLWSEIRGLVVGVFSRTFNDEQRYALKIILSMIPVAIVGFTLKDQLDEMLSSRYILLIVGIMLILTAALLGYAYIAKPKQKETISFRDSFIIGIAQAMAVMPGISRSGATIATGLILGNKKDSVAHFSFLMVLVPILGNTFLDVVGGEFSGGSSAMTEVGMTALTAGFLSAFVVGALACKIMIEIVKRGRLIWFSYYCLIVGMLSMVAFFFKG
ncbi:MAG: undecaprenyl-diphosphate phosphatase [Rikenellaceae bacterium]